MQLQTCILLAVSALSGMNAASPPSPLYISGGGVTPRDIIPYPVPPPGFLPPPPGVPHPQAHDTCPPDYPLTSCEHCKPNAGWCTEGIKAGCPCRIVCPSGDQRPMCKDDDCNGDTMAATCSLGVKKGCECRNECPEYPQKQQIDCKDNACKGDNQNECTDPKYRGCKCGNASSNPPTVSNDPPIDNNPQKHRISCQDGPATIQVAADFFTKMAHEFCNELPMTPSTKDLTSAAIHSNEYDTFLFHFELTPGYKCNVDCKAAFDSIASACQNDEKKDTPSIQAQGSSTYDCGAEYRYQIKLRKPDPVPPPVVPADQPKPGYIGEQQCWAADQFGKHSDVRPGDIDQYMMQICDGISGGEMHMDSKSKPLVDELIWWDTPYHWSIAWRDGCIGPPQDPGVPLGDHQTFPEDSKTEVTCWSLLKRDWKNCINGGVGGYRDVGCLRYLFKPQLDN